jgi:PTS system mannose-specific IID component
MMMAETTAVSSPTRELPHRLVGAVFWRSLALQASWNPQRMQNLGLLVCLLPWLRQQRLDIQEKRRFCRRHYEFFNTNPYLANFILGGLMSLEEGTGPEGVVSERFLRTFKNTLAQSFAALGDQFFWLGLQPTLFLLTCFLGLLAGPWGVLGLVGTFAAGQLILRRRALRVGYQQGLKIVDLLAHPAWHSGICAVKATGMFLTGCLGGYYLARFAAVEQAHDQIPGLVVALLAGGLPLILRQRIPAEGIALLTLPLALALAYL